MINLNSIKNKDNKRHREKWPYIPDHLYRILINGGSGSGKTNMLLNLIKEQDKSDVIDKIYLYARDLNKPKYQFLIETHEDAGIRDLNDPSTFIEYSNTMDDVYKQKKKNVFDDMIADIMRNRRFQVIIKELLIRCRKLNISFVFIMQSYFSVPKDVRLNSTHYLIMKINNRRELQNIAINHSVDIDYKDLMKIYRECAKEPYNFLTIDTTLPASDPQRFRKNLFNSL